MKKTILITAIVIVSLISTACINKFAVQELNNKAQELMQEGDIEGAISRLESCIDLDETLYETQYNLAVAYLHAKKYDLAIKTLERVKELNPEYAEAYYTIAVANEEEAYLLIDGEAEEVGNGESADRKELTDSDKKRIKEYLVTAIENYNLYLMKKPDTADRDKVEDKIKYLNNDIERYGDTEAEVSS